MSEGITMNSEQAIKNKIYQSFNDFEALLKTWKDAKLKIVFTNGCFDIFHRGHVDSLVKAASFGDKLVVGLNSDLSVRRLKGETRPVFNQESRAFVLASLMVVDAVIIFEEETPYSLIQKIQPDILVKGDEYKLEEVVGHDIVIARGGAVERIKITPGFSSSGIIRKILALDK